MRLTVLLLGLAVSLTAQAQNPHAIITTNHGEIEVELFLDAAPRTVENFLDLAEGKKSWTDPRTGGVVNRPYYDGLVFHRVIKGFMIQGGCPKGDGTGGPGASFPDEINAKALGLADKKAFSAAGEPQFHTNEQEFHTKFVRPVCQQLGITSNEQLRARQAEVVAKLAAMSLLEAYVMKGYSYSDTLPSRQPVKGCLAMANAGPNTNGSQFFINLGDTPHLAGLHTVFGQVVRGFEVVEKIGAVEVEPHSSRPLSACRIESIRKKP